MPSTDVPIDLLKSMNCCSPAVGNSCLVLMHVGTRQRKKSTKHLMSKASALALSPGCTIPATTAPGNSEGCPRAEWQQPATRPAPANMLPNSSRLPRVPAPLSFLPAPACLQLEACRMLSSCSQRGRRAEPAQSDPLSGLRGERWNHLLKKMIT